MDPTCGLGDMLRDLVLNHIWEQLLYLFCYDRNIDELNRQLMELTLERSSVQHRLDEAKNNGEQIEEKVLHWLGEVDELSEQVQKFHEESQAKTECNITSCPTPWLRYKLSKRAETIAQEAVKIYGKGNFNLVSYRVPPQSMPELTSRESNKGIRSRVEIRSHIMEALQNPRYNMIGLCGLGGVGKTTIAKDIEKEEKNQKVFEKVIMATVSQEMNIGQIQDQIIEKLGMQINERTEEVKASRLKKRLEKEKNMLLILDDLWQELDLGKVGIPFIDVERYSKINEGCKILLTSRNETLLSNNMKCQKLITVGVLSEDEAWELFQNIAKLSIKSSSSDLKYIATEIVQKCGGLPLAIATAAKALKDQNIDGWSDYLLRLKHPLSRSFTGIKEVDTILKLSYKPLSQENRDIFLLSAMLSHHPSIEDLLMYSVGLDILKHTQNMGDACNAIFQIVGKLKSSNLFLDSFSSHHFTMHDVFRDVALSIASEELSAVIVRHSILNEWPDKSDLEFRKGICLQESDICDLPEELHGPILEFFLLNSKKSDLTIPNMFFKSSEKLKVLAITNVHFSSLPSLSFLQRLKALCLHSCLLEDITDIKSLRKLKVLSLAYSEIQRLPVEVAELTSLQMLNLSHCSNLKEIPQNLLSRLKKLEVLYMGNSFNQWKVEDSSKANENASLDELRDLPISSLEIHIPNISMLPKNLFLDMNLKRYKISIGELWELQDNDETSKILKLELPISIPLKDGVPELLEGVEDLYLNGCNAQESVLHNNRGRVFPHLRHLQMDFLHSIHHEGATTNVSNKTVKSLFNSKVFLPMLEILELSDLLNRLTPLIWDDKLSHNSFNNLKVLVVKSCGFVKLVPLHVLKSLNNLEELDVKNCDMLENVFDFEDLNDYYKEMNSSSVFVPLKKLKLRNLPKLKNVWSDYYQGNISFPSLRSVVVSGCESLTSIFPVCIAKCMLYDLEELEISFCNIDVIVAKDRVSESVVAVFQFPALTSLKLYGLPQLRNFYSHRHTLEWPHLQRLSIHDCDELEIFEKEVSSSSEIYEEESTINSKYPLFSHDKVIHNLELNLAGKQAEMIGSGQFPMYHSPNVKLLRLFADNATTILYKTLLKSFPNLEELQFSGHFVEAFGGDDVATLASPFPILILYNILIERSLSPLLVSSPNLTNIRVVYCDNLFTLMTSSTARSLVHLTHLSIVNCDNIEEIITKQEGKNDEEIVFIKLKTLVLDGLNRLKRFCGYNYTFRFPLLDQLIIEECPSLKIFSPGLIHTPSLKSIQLSKHEEKQHEVQDVDLNKIFYQQRFRGLREVVLDKDDASMIRNDQLPTNCWPQAEIVRIDGFVEELVTCPYTLLERFPKLNELHVSNSSFREIFPSHAQLSTSLHNLTVLEVSHCHQLVYLMTISTAKSLVNLETLEIYDCEKLKEIIRKEPNEDAKERITMLNVLRILKLLHLPRLQTQEDKKDFSIDDRATNTRCTEISKSLFGHNKVLLPKLERLEVIWCHGLTTLMMSSGASSLVHITHLSIINCNQIEEIIMKQEGEDDEDREISFNQMKFLKLHDLPRLKKFCGYNYTFRFPSLEHVTITECFRLTMFCPKAIHAPRLQSIQVDKYKARKHIWMADLNNTIQHLFTFEEVISTCRSMALNSMNITMMKTINDVFPKVSSLYVESFTDEGVTFPYSCLERFPKLKWLNVEHCSFEKIFPSLDQIIDFMWKIPPFTGLCIANMDKLKSIWKDASQLPPIHQNLISLEVKSCCSLVRLAPSFASFENLIQLSISGCHHLIHLVTTSTAKSLVSLRWLEINDCKRMEEIVMNDTNEDVQGGITFKRLNSIKLTDMPSLKMFSSQSHTFEYPELEEIKISGCPEMKNFYTKGSNNI